MANYTVTDANVKASALGVIKSGIAAVEITPGQPIYENSPFDGTFGLADANAGLPNDNFAGYSLNHAYAGQPLDYVESDPEYEHGFTSVVVGTTVILSATAGKSCPDADNATGMVKTILGGIISSTKMILNPIRLGVVTP